MQQQLEAKQQKGLIDKNTLLLTVEDPKARVGSGGATLNALYVVAEHLGAKLGHTIVTADILQDAHILILHMGRNYPFDSCGRTFTSLPITHKESDDVEFVFTNLDMLLSTVSNFLAVDSPGVWVCSTDMIFTAPVPLPANTFRDKHFCIIATSASHRYARNHGALVIGKDDVVGEIVYKGKPDVLNEHFPSGDVPLISGVVFISTEMAERLISLTTIPPLDACTYIGLDNGAQPIELSIFFDMAGSMCINVDEDFFVTGGGVGIYGSVGKVTGPRAAAIKQARSILWRELHDAYRVHAVMTDQSQYCYLDHTASTHHGTLLAGTVLKQGDMYWEWKAVVHSQVPSNSMEDHATVINSIVEDGAQLSGKSIVSNCHIPSAVQIGLDSCLAGLRTTDFHGLTDKMLPERMYIQAFRIEMPILGKMTKMKVLTIVGKFDELTAPMWKGASTFCNSPWVLFLNATGENTVRFVLC